MRSWPAWSRASAASPTARVAAVGDRAAHGPARPPGTCRRRCAPAPASRSRRPRRRPPRRRARPRAGRSWSAASSATRRTWISASAGHVGARQGQRADGGRLAGGASRSAAGPTAGRRPGLRAARGDRARRRGRGPRRRPPARARALERRDVGHVGRLEPVAGARTAALQLARARRVARPGRRGRPPPGGAGAPSAATPASSRRAGRHGRARRGASRSAPALARPSSSAQAVAWPRGRPGSGRDARRRPRDATSHGRARRARPGAPPSRHARRDRLRRCPTLPANGGAALVDAEQQSDRDEGGQGVAPAVAHEGERDPGDRHDPTVIPMLTNTWKPIMATIAPGHQHVHLAGGPGDASAGPARARGA